MICVSAPFRGLFFLILLVCCANPVPGAEPANPDSALALALGRIDGAPLRLSDALDAAQSRSASLKTAQALLDAAQAVVQRERGAFDPTVFAEWTRAGSDQPSASPFAGAPVLVQKETSVQGGVRMRLPIGTELEASVSAVRQENNSNFSALNPQYTTVSSARFRQPLLEGFGVAGRKDLAAAEKQRDAAAARYDAAVFELRAQVEGLYWDLYAAERDLAVQILVRDQAGALLREAELRATAGLVGPNQVANAQVFLSEQRLALLDREAALDRISDQLAALMGMRPEDASRYRPVDAPPRQFDLADVDQVVADALRQNGALKGIRAEGEAIGALVRAAHRNRLPTVDLLGVLGGNGLSGAGQDVFFGSDTLRTTISGGYGDALSQALTRDFPTWEIGLRLEIPIGNRADRGEAARLRADRLRVDQQTVLAERGLDVRVRTEYRALQHGTERLAIARAGVTAAAEQVRIGLIEYRNGRTTAFELVRLGADFAAAQQRYSQALVRIARAASTLRYLTAGQHPSF